MPKNYWAETTDKKLKEKIVLKVKPSKNICFLENYKTFGVKLKYLCHKFLNLAESFRLAACSVKDD